MKCTQVYESNLFRYVKQHGGDSKCILAFSVMAISDDLL
jgi:hypothetical protein